MASRRQEFLAGSKDVFPLAVGVASLMTVWGAVTLSAGIPAWIAQFMTLTTFAGSQFLMAQLIAVGTPAGMIIVASSLVNLRHLLYSASMAPLLRDLIRSGKGFWPIYSPMKPSPSVTGTISSMAEGNIPIGMCWAQG